MKMLKWAAAMACVMVLVACGGGGDAGSSPFGPGAGAGSGAGAGDTLAEPSISLTVEPSTVTAGAPATVSAVVRDATGAGIAGQVVTFSTQAKQGSFSVPSALTDATGTAVVSLSPASSTAAGADQVIAAATINGTPVQSTAGFQLTATSVSIDSFTSDVSSLSAYGQTALSVVLAGAPPSMPVSVEISSACVAKGKATLTPASITTSTGSATFTYRDQGCGATDLNDALSASVTGTAATAALSLGLTSPTVSSITFVSASAPTIYLKGSGLNEASEVIFQVRDQAGNGIPNQSIVLEPTTLTGGLTLDGGSSALTKQSDSLGNVSVRINSGTVPTPVRIKASLASSPGVSTVSSNLAVAVGLPAQLNFSLSQETKNIEGYNIDGTENTYNIIASDRLGNQVPDGTAINFVVEGGQVEAIKFTQGVSGISRATANFVSASPRPIDGRVTVLAYALGEESFLDTNGNNIYDTGESFQDLGNLFLNRRFDGYYNKDVDQFIALGISGASACAPATGLMVLDKTIPSISQSNSSTNAGTCDGAWGRAYVRRATETVFSTSAAWPLWSGKPAALVSAPSDAACQRGDDVTDPGNRLGLITDYDEDGLIVERALFYSFGNAGLYGVSASGVLSFIVADANPVRLNPMPAGTTISVSASKGLTVTVEGGTPVPSTLEATYASVSYAFDATTTTGTITVSFTSPGGLKSSIGQFITTDSSLPPIPCQ